MHFFQGEIVYTRVNNQWVGPAVPFECRPSPEYRYVYDLLYYKDDDPNYLRDEFNVPENELHHNVRPRGKSLGGEFFFERRNRNIR